MTDADVYYDSERRGLYAARDFAPGERVLSERALAYVCTITDPSQIVELETSENELEREALALYMATDRTPVAVRGTPIPLPALSDRMGVIGSGSLHVRLAYALLQMPAELFDETQYYCRRRAEGGAATPGLYDNDPVTRVMVRKELAALKRRNPYARDIAQVVRTVHLYTTASSTFSYAEYGLGFYSMVAHINHSCDANCVMSSVGDESRVCAWMRPIKEGDEITISYVSGLDAATLAIRRSKLLKNMLFKCECPRCLEQHRVEVQEALDAATQDDDDAANARREADAHQAFLQLCIGDESDDETADEVPPATDEGTDETRDVPLATDDASIDALVNDIVANAMVASDDDESDDDDDDDDGKGKAKDDDDDDTATKIDLVDPVRMDLGTMGALQAAFAANDADEFMAIFPLVMERAYPILCRLNDVISLRWLCEMSLSVFKGIIFAAGTGMAEQCAFVQTHKTHILTLVAVYRMTIDCTPPSESNASMWQVVLEFHLASALMYGAVLFCCYPNDAVDTSREARAHFMRNDPEMAAVADLMHATRAYSCAPLLCKIDMGGVWPLRSAAVERIQWHRFVAQLALDIEAVNGNSAARVQKQLPLPPTPDE